MRMMPKFLVWMAILTTLFAGICEVDTAKSDGLTPDSVYAELGVIVSFDYDNDEVFAVDANGNIWSFYEIEDWFIGDYVVMVFDTKGTDGVFDDEIIRVFYERPDLVARWS